MKGNSLFKKIGAIATTAAMLASLGVTGFAEDDNSITIKNISVTESTTTGVYNVEVVYESNVANKIGVTMLTYVGKTDGTNSTKKLDASDADAEAKKAADDRTIVETQIAGVDQNDDATTEGGTFKFSVTTNSEGGNVQMSPGEYGIVLLGGDRITSPAAAFFSIPVPAGVVSSVGSITTHIDYPYYVSDDEKKESIKESALAALGTGVQVTVGEKKDDPDTEDTIAVTADFAGTHDTEVKKTTEGVYTLVITLKSDVTTANSTYKLTTGTDIEIPLTNVTATALPAETVSVKGNVEGFKLELLAAERGEKELAVAIADKIEATGLVFKDNTNNSAEVNSTTDPRLAVTATITSQPDDDATEIGGVKVGDYIVSYTVAAPAETYAGANGAIVDFSDTMNGTDTVTVTYKAAGPQWACGDVDLDKSIGINDATALLKHLAKIDGFEYVADYLTVADTDGDKAIGINDATTLLKHLAKIDGFATLPLKAN